MITAAWEAPNFDLDSVAPDTGPFPFRPYLMTWWRQRASPSDELLLVHDDHALLPAMRRNARIELVGDPDLTDYHSPLGHDMTGVAAQLAASAPGVSFRFDSLPAPAATVLAAAFAAAGTTAVSQQHDVATVLALPPTFDDYVAGLGKKDRHETRRKRRRFAAELGEPHLDRREGDEAVAMFAEMHRTASGNKGHFMTDQMEHFFTALHTEVGGLLDVLCDGDGRPVAAGFGFEDDSGYYLYNSAYDPAASHASPGMVLLVMLIERAIAAGRQRFDFLKGDEPYKFRLGAEARPLFELTGTLGVVS